MVWEFDTGGNFLQHGAERQKHTHHGGAESRVFGLEGGQGNLALEVRLPQYGTSAKNNDASSSGLCGGWGTVRVAAMKTTEVDVNVKINIQVACMFDNMPMSQFRCR
jgi:hypothetical protein